MRAGKLIIIFLFFILQLPAQQDVQNDSQLALQYYKDKEYDKAAPLYQKLYQQTGIKTYFTYYIFCLTELKQFEDAEKVIRKEIKLDKTEPTNYLELGYLFKFQNKLKESDEAYSQAISVTKPDQSAYINLANLFLSRREYDYAEKTFLEARKNLKGGYGFQFEMAWVYQQKGKYDQMISEYLNLLELNESYVQSVQNRLQATVYNETEGDLQEMLKKSLVIRIQKRPDKTIFVEMLIWLYIQDKDFANALVQARSLDKRFDEGSKRIYEIGGLAGDAEQYDIAADAYKYIIDKGINDAYYIDAKSDNLGILYKKIIGSGTYTQTDVLGLEKQFAEALTDLGLNKSTFSLAVNQARLQAFYLSQPDKAIENITTVSESGKLNPLQVAEAKILLGDIYLFKMEIWEATLIYAQVEKMYPNEPIGHDAKLKKARLAYYSGDFKWSEAQLSVLKAATSKLIANDAFGLSMLIKDNMVDDSEGKALLIFSRAEWLHYRMQDSLAMLTLDSVITLFPGNVIVDDALFLKGRYFQGAGKFAEASAEYEKVIKGYPYDILADDALYARAMLYYNKLNEPETARDLFKKLVTSYPGSIYISESRRIFRELREKYPEIKTTP